MAKMNEYRAGREDGLNLALSIVKERGIEGLEEEIRFRNLKIGIYVAKNVTRKIIVFIDAMQNLKVAEMQ